MAAILVSIASSGYDEPARAKPGLESWLCLVSSISQTCLGSTPVVQGISYGLLVYALTFFKGLWTMGPYFDCASQWCHNELTGIQNWGPILRRGHSDLPWMLEVWGGLL